MRAILIVLAMTASGCVSALDYGRVRGELDATRNENVRLRDENDELRRGLARATTKLSTIDAILHDGRVDAAAWPPTISAGR